MTLEALDCLKDVSEDVFDAVVRSLLSSATDLLGKVSWKEVGYWLEGGFDFRYAVSLAAVVDPERMEKAALSSDANTMFLVRSCVTIFKSPSEKFGPDAERWAETAKEIVSKLNGVIDKKERAKRALPYFLERSHMHMAPFFWMSYEMGVKVANVWPKVSTPVRLDLIGNSEKRMMVYIPEFLIGTDFLRGMIDRLYDMPRNAKDARKDLIESILAYVPDEAFDEKLEKLMTISIVSWGNV